jgi:fibronectin type 3 domain-containing protein
MYSPIDTITGLYYNDSVPSTSTYYYKMSGLDSTGEVGYLSGYLSAYAYSPSAPIGESASWDQYPNGVTYVWNKSSNAISYIVYRSTSSGGTKIVLDTINDTLFFDTTVTPSVTGYYSVRYLNSHGLLSAGSTEISGRRLGPPISLSASGYANYIRLSWSGSSTSGIYYKIYRSTSSSGPFTILDSTSATLYSDTVSSLVYYYYKISSFKNGESQLSTVYSGRLSTPLAPAMVSASMGTALAVRVVWNSVQGAQSYKLYRSTSSSFLNPLFLSDITDTLFLDTVPTDSVYYYKCKAVSIAGESSLSSISKSGYRLSISPPLVPVSLYVSDDASSYIYMYWSMTSNIPMVSQYKIYRSDVQSGPFQLIDSTSNASYTDYVPKTYPDKYWYYVTSWNLVGESAPSDTMSGYRP